MFTRRRKTVRCSVCMEEIEDGCGMRYKMKVKRYSPDGYFCVMPKNGAVCEACLKKLGRIIREYDREEKEATA